MNGLEVSELTKIDVKDVRRPMRGLEDQSLFRPPNAVVRHHMRGLEDLDMRQLIASFR